MILAFLAGVDLLGRKVNSERSTHTDGTRGSTRWVANGAYNVNSGMGSTSPLLSPCGRYMHGLIAVESRIWHCTESESETSKGAKCPERSLQVIARRHPNFPTSILYPRTLLGGGRDHLGDAHHRLSVLVSSTVVTATDGQQLL